MTETFGTVIDPDNAVFLAPSRKIDTIVLHHSATTDGKAFDWAAIRRYHKETNGWQEIGYHYGIEEVAGDYKIYTGRDLLMKGAHTKEADFNSRSIGICMVGNFDLIPVPVPQWALALHLVRKLQSVFHIPTERIFGHREAIAAAGVTPYKSCPGKLADMDAFRRDLAWSISNVA